MKINISRAPDDERVETSPILSEARARIIWGEHALSVRDYLISRGIERGAADLKIAQFLKERNSVIRKLAIKKILLGGLLLAVAVSFVLYCTLDPKFGWTSRTVRGVAVFCAVGFYGFCKLINGIIYLAGPQCEKESITELSE
jgi:hypothetical protein